MKKLVNGQIVDMTAEEIAEFNSLQTDINIDENQINKENQAPYINQRKNAYPEIGDQLDMLWHTIDKDPQLKSKYFDFYEAIKAVKVKYPKS